MSDMAEMAEEAKKRARMDGRLTGIWESLGNPTPILAMGLSHKHEV